MKRPSRRSREIREGTTKASSVEALAVGLAALTTRGTIGREAEITEMAAEIALLRNVQTIGGEEAKRLLVMMPAERAGGEVRTSMRIPERNKRKLPARWFKFSLLKILK